MVPMRRSPKLGQLLVRAGVLDARQLAYAEGQIAQGGGSLIGYLVDRGVGTEEQIVAALARVTGVPQVDLTQCSPPPPVLALIDASVCEERGIFPVAIADNGRTLLLATSDPTDVEAADFVAASCGLRVRAHVAGERAITHAIRRCYFNELPGGGTGEFKIVDAAGKTLHPTQMGSSPAGQAVPGLEQQLEALRGTVESQERMIRALMDALFQKQLLTAEDVLRARKASQ